MPRREIDPEVFVNTPKKSKPKGKPKAAAAGHKLPEPLPDGMEVTDVMKRKWKLGKSIGVGGFGEIYLASDNIKGPVGPNAPYVMKIEHHSNGPLFSEIHFYHRVAKEEKIEEWTRNNQLDYLGMPRFVASGSHEYGGIKYRFMVMDRFGSDLQKMLNSCGNTFAMRTVFILGIRILDILQYIHSFGYIHADVKASNLLLGYGTRNQNKVYLVDFGLACKYIVDGKHKENKEDLRKAHDGTIEFTSRDAHIGAHSRRGDLEILGYNMLQWLCKKLPWEDNLANPEYVSHQKNGFMSSIPQLMKKCFPGKNYPEAIGTFLEYISQLKFDEEPNYSYCRNLFKDTFKKSKIKFDLTLKFTPMAIRKAAAKRTKETAGSSNEDDQSPRSAKDRKKDIAKLNFSTSSSVSDEDNKQNDMALENPTPAMLQVMQRRLELQKQQRDQRKKSASYESDRESLQLKEKIVRRYKEKSPTPDVFDHFSGVAGKSGSSQRIRRLPLSTRPTQAAPPPPPRRNYSPEV